MMPDPDLKFTDEELSLQNGFDGSIDLEINDNIAIVRMRCGENRLNYTFTSRMNKVLDEVERNENIEYLITIGDGRFYGNGLDLQWLGMIGTTPNGRERLTQFRNDYLVPLFIRILTFPIPTVAALNGHCYAGGAVVALCHDCVIMNSEKGWFCFNEVHNGLRFNGAMYEILAGHLTPGKVFNEVAVLGKRFTGPEAVSSGIITAAVPPGNLLNTAINLARSLPTPARESLGIMKQDMYAKVIKAHQEDCKKQDPNFVSISKL